MNQSDNGERFSGIQRLYGNVEAEQIGAMHVCVIGIGGVGSWALEALARSGVGALTLIDYDTICASNINRQVHALKSSLGRKKEALLGLIKREGLAGLTILVADDPFEISFVEDGFLF